MIGGKDTIIEGKTAVGEGIAIVRMLRQRWGWADLVVQDAEAESSVGALDPAVASMREFFVYQSPAAFSSWNAEGCTDTNDAAMVHVILGDTSTTLVHAPSLNLEAIGRAVSTCRLYPDGWITRNTPGG